MTPLSKEPNLDKNYIMAFALAMLVLLTYPFFLKMVSPQKPVLQQEQTQPQELLPNPQTPEGSPLKPAEGPFLSEAVKPSIIQFENSLYEAKFSTLGATITELVYKGDGQERVDQTSFFTSNGLESGIFGTRLLHEEADLANTVFKLYRSEANQNLYEFLYEKPGQYRILKKYIFDSQRPVIHLTVSLENISPREKHFPLELVYGLDYQITPRYTEHDFEGVAAAAKIHSANLGKIKKGFSVSEEVEWVGLVKKYFSILVKPDAKVISTDFRSDEKSMWGTLRLEPLTIAPGASRTQEFLIYAGPQRYETLKGLGFEDLLSRGFFGLFKIWFLVALKFLYGFTHNFGWAIILLTLIIKGVFTPLTHMSFENMKKMQVLQPKLKNLQERYKGDPSKLNKEMMALYKRNKVNPMGGCLPMLLQIPIFIAFYQVLNETIELKGAPFIFWIKDLSEPDRLFHLPMAIPFIGDSFNFLPLLMIASQYFQQKLTPQAGVTPEQTKMMEFMPLIFGVMFYQMPSGLVLYWFINNTLSVVHQIFVKRMVVVLHHEDKD